MESLTLSKGEVLELLSANELRLAVGLGWSAQVHQPSYSLSLDASAIPRDKNGTAIAIVSRDNAKGNPQRNINLQAEWCDHLGSYRIGNIDNEQIRVDPLHVPLDIASVDFCLTIRDAQRRQHHLGMLDTAFIRIIDSETKKELLRFDLNLDSLSGYGRVIVGRLVRNGSTWKFVAVGQAHQDFGSMQPIAP